MHAFRSSASSLPNERYAPFRNHCHGNPDPTRRRLQIPVLIAMCA